MARRMMDIALGPDNDLLIQGGDFVVRESTAQHQVALILDNKGEYTGNPTICAGAVNYIDDEGKEGVVRAISREFLQDGMEVQDMTPNPASVTDNTVRPFLNAFYI